MNKDSLHILMLRTPKAGFTLIELMIVVVIIGVLAAVAIPQFNKYMLQSRTTEATQNVGAIRWVEHAFFSRWNHYGLVMRNPPGTPDGDRRPWQPTSNVGFDLLGYQPSGHVYYQYAVIPWTAADFDGASCALPEADGNVALSADGGGGVSVSHARLRNSDGNAVMIYARGDLMQDGVFSCFATGDANGDILPVPPGSGNSVF